MAQGVQDVYVIKFYVSIFSVNDDNDDDVKNKWCLCTHVYVFYLC